MTFKINGTVRRKHLIAQTAVCDDYFGYRKPDSSRLARSPINRVEEVASAAFYLASDEPDFVTRDARVVGGAMLLTKRQDCAPVSGRSCA